MLVLDRSGSMGSEGKLAAAKNAVQAFLNLMDLSQEQAGIASFASSATLNQQLTQNRTALDNVVTSLVASGGTEIGEGIYVAQAELESSRRIVGHVPAMVLLSDGQNGSGRDPVTAAQTARAAGTIIFTIGLGTNADAALLEQIASQLDYYYYAPGTDELMEIYETIADQIRCLP